MRTKDRPELQREITTNVLPQFNLKLIDLLDKNPEFSKVSCYLQRNVNGG